MRDHDDMPYIVIERRSGGATPFLWGLLLGAGAALLLAPRSGAETQDEIRQQAQRIRRAAEDRVTGARDSVTGAVTRTRNRVYDRIDTVRDVVETRTQQAREALDAGRRAALDARSELERRVAQAKETLRPQGGGEGGTEGNLGASPPVPPVGEVVVTEVVVEEAEGRPDLG